MLGLLSALACTTPRPAESPPEPVEKPAPARARPEIEQAIALAEATKGTPWKWNGRLTPQLPGLDCLGIIFVAYGEATGTPWRDYPVNPSELVASAKLGNVVPEVAGVLRGNVPVDALKRGDILYFLVEGYEIPDKPLLVDGERRYWPWHTGIYLGDGNVLNSHPSQGVVVMRLTDISWDALFATRP